MTEETLDVLFRFPLGITHITQFHRYRSLLRLLLPVLERVWLFTELLSRELSLLKISLALMARKILLIFIAILLLVLCTFFKAYSQDHYVFKRRI